MTDLPADLAKPRRSRLRRLQIALVVAIGALGLCVAGLFVLALSLLV